MGRIREFDRDEVLECAVEVFWSRGYEATSIDDLTAAMGIGRGSLYNEFGDKHSLFVESLDRYRAARRAELEEVLRAAPSARAGIETLFRLLARRLRADPGHRGCLLVNAAAERASADPAVAERVNATLAAFASAFRESLERGRRDGEFSPALDVTVMANYLASTLICLRLLPKFGDPAIADHLVQMSLLTLKTVGGDGRR